MWQRFTEQARKVIFFAQEEAVKFGETYVSTEHILLGLLREPECTAVKILGVMGLSAYDVRKDVEEKVTLGDMLLEGDMQLTPRAKRVIELAYDESRSLGGKSITSKHLLLGLIREGDGMAACVLRKLGVDIDIAHQAAASLQDMEIAATDPEISARIHAMRSEALKIYDATIAAPAMRDESRKILQGIIEEYGAEICSDHERCIGLLWERRGNYSREIMALQLFLQAGIVEEMIASSDSSKGALFVRLSHKATELTPIDRECAMWAIASWSLALGIINEKD